jgi:hypothetical protein
MQETIDAQRRGYHQAVLTEMDTATIPQIASGSIVEVAGSLYEATSNESISGSTAGIGTLYIKLVPGTGVVTPTWTAIVPTWDDAKQGWYGTGGSASHRYIKYRITQPVVGSYYKFYDLHENIRRTYVYAYWTGQLTGSSLDANPVIFNVEVDDRLSEYNSSTGVFTAKQSGTYLVSSSIRFDYTSGTVVAGRVRLYKNSAQLHLHQANQTYAGFWWVHISVPVKLIAGDTLYIRATIPAGTGVLGSTSNDSDYLYITRIE